MCISSTYSSWHVQFLPKFTIISIYGAFLLMVMSATGISKCWQILRGTEIANFVSFEFVTTSRRQFHDVINFTCFHVLFMTLRTPTVVFTVIRQHARRSLSRCAVFAKSLLKKLKTRQRALSSFSRNQLAYYH